MVSRPLVIAFCDQGYLPLLERWTRRVRQLGVTRIKIFCLDAPTQAWCATQAIPAARIPWTGALRDLWVQRIAVFSDLLAAGESFVHSDIDAVWLGNPLEAGAAAGRGEDLLFSQGTVWPPDVHDRWGFVLCCGWFQARPTAAAQAFFRALEANVRESGDDQISVNRLLVAMGAAWATDRREGRAGAPGLLRGADYSLGFRDREVQCWREPLRGVTAGGLSVALLPHREFQRLPEAYPDALVKHYLTPKSCAHKLAALHAFGLL